MTGCYAVNVAMTLILVITIMIFKILSTISLIITLYFQDGEHDMANPNNIFTIIITIYNHNYNYKAVVLPVMIRFVRVMVSLFL